MKRTPKNRFVQQVYEFHEAFGHPIGENTSTLRCMPLHESTGLLHLRRKLIHEEAQETCEALYQYMKLLYTDQDELQKDAEQATRKEVLDGLCDVLVVAIGTALALGLDIEEAMERVHTSNMSKLGADGRPIYRKDGKIMKGPDYKEPDFDDLV